MKFSTAPVEQSFAPYYHKSSELLLLLVPLKEHAMQYRERMSTNYFCERPALLRVRTFVLRTSGWHLVHAGYNRKGT